MNSHHVFKDKNIILGVSGGIAAYKALELLRLLSKKGAKTRVIMTKNATHFVGPTSFEALSGLKVVTDLFNTHHDESIGHITWAESADAVIIAPATANIIGKLAGGIADDALSTVMMAITGIPVVLSPAMNTHMYLNPGVQSNIKRLQELFGYEMIPPDVGKMACGTEGPGRLPAPVVILDRLTHAMTRKDLSGKRVLVTAGPTHEYIDPVRFIGNPSSGKMGFAVAKAAEHRGAKVTLITGPTHLDDLSYVDMIHVTSSEEMAKAVFHYMEDADIVIKSAAVSDYRPKHRKKHKVKKGSDDQILELEKTQDILKTMGFRKKGKILVGFAAETEDLHKYAREKLQNKNLDIIVGNLIGPNDSGFGYEKNQVTLFFSDGRTKALEVMDKIDVAHQLLDSIVCLEN